jgi:type II secretory pathway component GspD/PulD (secretin)
MGALFGTKTNSKKRTELIIFLTPHVVYDTNHVAEATQDLKDKLRVLRKTVTKNVPEQAPTHLTVPPPQPEKQQ